MNGGERPNIILLVLDALRADAVEPYGAPAGSSPVIADLAHRGCAVPGVRATASWTLPSHVAIFTGRLARSVGLGQAPGGTPQGAAPVVREQRSRLLADVLRGAGYSTAGISTNLWAGKSAGFDTGFDQFVELDTSRQNAMGSGVRERVRWAREGLRATSDDGARSAEAVLREWINAHDARPFFWFINLVECHGPYLPPRPWHGASALTRLRAADEAHRYLNFDAILRAALGIEQVPEGAKARMRRLYAASVRYADAWVGRLVEALERAGRWEGTLLVVCSDHGENLGEGGLLTHGMSLDDRLLRVPLIGVGPGAAGLEGMLSLAQLPSRLARAAGIEDDCFGDGLVDGVPVAQWDPWALPEERLVEIRSRWKLGPEAIHRLTSPLTCAVADGFKLVRGASDEDEMLYDLHADPLEQTPLRDAAAIASRAGGALPRLRAAVRSDAAQARGQVTLAPDEVSEAEVADIERRMRAMGYM